MWLWQDRLAGSTGLMEILRASWWHARLLQGNGAKIGRGTYFDTTSFVVRLDCLFPHPCHMPGSAWQSVTTP